MVNQKQCICVILIQIIFGTPYEQLLVVVSVRFLIKSTNMNMNITTIKTIIIIITMMIKTSGFALAWSG